MKHIFYTFLIFPCLLSAQIAVTPTAVTLTQNSTFGSYDLNSLIDNSGLSYSGNVHGTDWQDSWLSESLSPNSIIEFDLGSLFTLNRINVWNYGYFVYYRQAKTINVSFSEDNVSWLSDAETLSLSFQTSFPVIVESIEITPIDARYVRFEITENHGSSDHVGLGEVKFEAIPEPETYAAILGLTILLGLMIKRARIFKAKA